MWIMNNEDPKGRGHEFLGWRRGMWSESRSVHLNSVTNPHLSGPSYPYVKQWDIQLSNFSVPENMDTVYWCKIFKAPPLSKKHHIIGFEPLVSLESRHLVHHMLLYECVGAPSLMGQYLHHPGAACDSPSMPPLWQLCVSPTIAWAVSSSGDFLPDHVGIPITESKKATYFMLEIHYDNPALKEVTDSSGLRLFYTDRLRQNDGAIMVTGIIISPLQVIPPGQKAYKSAGYCDFHCTDSTLSSGINVISALLHSHRAGREITLRHIRGGVELSPIAQDKTYDFNYQQSRVLTEEKKILPGDEIVTECVYNTEGRPDPTTGGYSTKQEMCLGFLTYYPRSSLASCLSMTPVEFFFHTFGVKRFYHYNMTTIENMFLRLTDNQVVKKVTSTTPPSFPKMSPNDEINVAMNEEAISTLKKMADFSIEGDIENSLFDTLIIEEPQEFHNRSFISHLKKLPWTEELLTQTIEKTVYRGKHMTFCRLHNDSLQTPPQVFDFPNFTEFEIQPLNISCPPQQKQHLNGFRSSDTSSVKENPLLVWILLMLLVAKVLR